MSRRRGGGRRPQGRRRGRGANRGNADRVLAQGVGRAVSRAFGNIGGRPNHMMKLNTKCWDAFSMVHAPLPRAVGPYTVIRTTKLITSSDKVMMFCTSVNNNGAWRPLAAISSVTESSAIASAGNARSHLVPFPGVAVTGSAITAVPSALSVQVMNPNPLQTTTGIFAGAVSTTQFDLTGRTGETWNDFATNVISYLRPRLMSAGKLALRGVQADAYPLNMAALANFETVDSSEYEGTFTWDDTTGVYPAGFSPIVFINEGKVNMNYLVTTEWRVRFDIGNPAVATHSDHGVSTDQSWASAISSMVARGHGMIDIADRVADVGTSLGGLAQSAVSSRGMRALAGYAQRAPLMLT